MTTQTKTFTITKKIAKHGNQAVLIIPTILQNQLKPGTLAEIRIEILEQN
jgi:antitoxin component of MazEF toxin-antitoxin module